jgi:site-specific DNA recombinase
MKKAIIYIRVSTDEQADKGYSLRHQEEFLKKYCEFNNIEALEVIKEDYSAKTFNRPAFTQLLNKLKSRKLRADFLVFTKWDRFSRNAPDAYAMISTLNKLGIEPQAIEQPLDLNIPENKIMLAFYLSAPEVENDRRSLNTIAGMRRAKKEGRWVSTAPRGYENKYDAGNKKIIIHNKDAPVLKWAFEQLSTGKFTVEDIRKQCGEKGFDFKRGSFHEIFKNPIYCGRIIIPAYKNEEEQIVIGIHEPIVSEALYDKVQVALKNRRFKQIYKTCVQEPLPLRGFLTCPQCGKNLCGSGSTGGSGIKHYYYHCLKGCKERVKANDVNTAYAEYIATFKFKSGVKELYTEILKTVFKVNTGEKNANEKGLQTEIEKNKERLNKAQQLMLDGEMEMSEYKEIKRNIEPKIDALLSQQLSFNQTELEYRSYLKKGLSAVQHLGYLFDNLDINGKRDIVRSSLRKNLVFSDGKTRTEKPNELLSLISLVDVQHKGFKKAKGSENRSLSAHVPYGLDLSNFIDDFQALRILMNSRTWKSIL